MPLLSHQRDKLVFTGDWDSLKCSEIFWSQRLDSIMFNVREGFLGKYNENERFIISYRAMYRLLF